MTKKIIIGFTGLIASGKEVSKKYLEKKYQATSFKFSTVLREALDCLGLEQSRDNLIALSTWSRQTFGEDLLAKALANKVKASERPLIVVDGIRRLADIEYLKIIPGFHLIAIDADSKIRYQRSVLRNENPGDAEKTYEHFLADHQRETEITIPEIMAQAEYTLDNNGSFEELETQIDKIITQIQNS
jgi:dephospho-CoA kinase